MREHGTTRAEPGPGPALAQVLAHLAKLIREGYGEDWAHASLVVERPGRPEPDVIGVTNFTREVG